MAKLTMPDGAVYETASDEAAKSVWDRETTSQTILKSIGDQRYTLSVGYPADLADMAKSRDGHRDFANREEVEKAAWGYMDGDREVGLFHEEDTEGAGKVVESYVYRGPDWDADGQVIKSGDWLVGIVWNEPAWQLIQEGHVNGTSMQGRAKRRSPSPADVARVKANRGN